MMTDGNNKNNKVRTILATLLAGPLPLAMTRPLASHLQHQEDPTQIVTRREHVVFILVEQGTSLLMVPSDPIH